MRERIVVCINKEGYSEKVLGGLAKELGGKLKLVDNRMKRFLMMAKYQYSGVYYMETRG